MAKQNTEYEEGRKKLAGLLKTEPIRTPIQEVRPVEEEAKAATSTAKGEKQSHVNFWVSDDLMTRLKVHSAMTKKSIKQIGIEALEAYLKKNT